MEKRAFERTDTNLPVKYYCENMTYNGTIKNLSESGMYISTTNFLPCIDRIEMIIPLQEEVLKFLAMIRRIEKVNDTQFNIGIELLDPSDTYLKFVDSLKSSGKACNLK